LDEQPVETTLYSLDDRTPEPLQRRSSERYLSLLRVGALVIGERRELCLIKNVSEGGMLIRSYSRIAPGDRLSVELKQGDPVSGTVRWIDDDCVGVSFDEPIDVLELISTSQEGPRPRMPRIEVHCTAWVREGAIVRRTNAENISQGGIKIRCSEELTPGAEVIVTLPGLAPMPGVVRWSDGEAYGITFNRVIALPQLVEWLQEQRGERRAAG
jgi:hypothetical protein